MDHVFEGMASIIAVAGLFGWIPIMVWWKHRIRLEEIRHQHGAGINEETLHTLRAMQQEMRELRETSTKFDLSFDAGLERLEQRLNRVEQVDRTVPAYRSKFDSAQDAPTVQVGNRER